MNLRSRKESDSLKNAEGCLQRARLPKKHDFERGYTQGTSGGQDSPDSMEESHWGGGVWGGGGVGVVGVVSVIGESGWQGRGGEGNTSEPIVMSRQSAGGE